MHALALAAAVLLGSAPPPTPVTVHRNLVYGEHPVRNALDVYEPQPAGVSGAEGARPLPFLVFIHGGGWSEGDKGKSTRRGTWLARHGFVYATINYRLSPAVKHPAHVEDVARALAYLRENAAKWGADGQRMYLLGHSAGAHLAALVATDERRLALHGMSPGEFIRGVVLLDGSGYDVVERIPGSRGWSRRVYVQAFGEDPEVWRDASPLHHVTPSSEAQKRLPAFLLFHVAGRRASVKQARAFGERLEAAGTKAEVVGVAGRNHVSILKRLGAPGDPVAKRMLGFLAELESEAGRALPPPSMPEPPPEEPDESEDVFGGGGGSTSAGPQPLD